MATVQYNAVVTTGLIVVSVIFPLLSLSSILLRYKARTKSRSGFQADDWFVVAAWVATLGLSINSWVFGSIAGIDHYKINPEMGISKSLQCLLVNSLILQVSLSVVKISILLFYRRIFFITKFQVVAWIAIFLVGAWGIIFFFLVLFEGNPISASWTGLGTYNFDTVALGLAQVGSSIALDVVVLALPLPIISTLHLPARRKIAVMFIFWLGAFCCVAAIVRLVLLHASLSEVANNDRMVGTQSKNIIFMILEANCSVIAACLPCYGPLLSGGKSPSAMIRSIQSVFSLRSRSSKSSSINLSSNQLKSTAADASAGGESQTELVDAPRNWASDWGSKNQNAVTVGRESTQIDEEIGATSGPGIRMTTKVDVSVK